MQEKENWELQITNAIEMFKKRSNYFAYGEISFHKVMECALTGLINETNITGSQLVKTYLQKSIFDLNSDSIKNDSILASLLNEIESLGLYPSLKYKYKKGVILKIVYIKHFSTDLKYFLEKAKRVYYPESLQIQEMFGTDNLRLYELWFPEYEKCIKESTKKYLGELFKNMSEEITNEIDRL